MRVQRLKARPMGAINMQMTKLARNISVVTDCVRELTTAVVEGNRQTNTTMQELGRVMQEGHNTQRRRHWQFMMRLAGYTRSNNKLCNTTALLSHRSVAMQIDMGHCCGDVARALGQVTTAVEQRQAGTVGLINVTGEEGSEEASSLSRMSAPLNTGRRRSTRSTTPNVAPMSDVADAGETRLGVRGRKR